jgi:hypothetical protein
MYFLYNNEYRIFKPSEITVRRGLRYKGEKESSYNTYIHGNVTMKLPVYLS